MSRPDVYLEASMGIDTHRSASNINVMCRKHYPKRINLTPKPSPMYGASAKASGTDKA